MKIAVFIVLAIAIAAAVAVGMKDDNDGTKTTTKDDTVMQVENTTLETPAALTAQSWVWTGGTIAGEAVTPTTVGEFVASFSPEGQFSSTTDCNSLAGSYQAGANNIAFGALAATRMACMNETLETTYSAALASMSQYVVSDVTLTLQNEAGDILTFQAQ